MSVQDLELLQEKRIEKNIELLDSKYKFQDYEEQVSFLRNVKVYESYKSADLTNEKQRMCWVEYQLSKSTNEEYGTKYIQAVIDMRYAEKIYKTKQFELDSLNEKIKFLLYNTRPDPQ